MRMHMPGIDDFPVAPESFVAGKYLMEITGYEEKFSEKTGEPFTSIKLTIEEGPTSTNAKGEPITYEGREFTHVIFPIPEEGEDWRIESAKRRIRNFLEAFEIPWDDEGFDFDDAIGCTAWAILGPQKKNPNMMEVKKFEAA